MKRRSWTHGTRYSIHRQVLELRSLPDSNHIAWGEGARRERAACERSLMSLRTELAKIKAQARNVVEMARNQRLASLREALRMSVLETMRRREMAKLQALPEYASTSSLGRALLRNRVSFGGQTATQAVAA